ncbi:MAG: hydrogenase maturation protease [Pirellulaceae bacterium]
MTKHTLIVGVGSPHGDDQAGWLVAEQLAETLDQDDVEVRKATAPAQLLDWLDGTDRLIVCDACHGLGRIGQVRRWTWPDRELADAVWAGTHDLALPAVLQLVDRLGRLPQSMVVWSVEGAASNTPATISSEVAAALPRLIADIANEVRSR